MILTVHLLDILLRPRPAGCQRHRARVGPDSYLDLSSGRDNRIDKRHNQRAAGRRGIASNKAVFDDKADVAPRRGLARCANFHYADARAEGVTRIETPAAYDTKPADNRRRHTQRDLVGRGARKAEA